MSIDDQFKGFWETYVQFIGIFAGAFVGHLQKKCLTDSKKGKDKE
jgi:hypothetical protein